MGENRSMDQHPGSGLRIDLNADLGEEITDDDALLEVVTSANVACGYHAGGRAVMDAVCAGAAARGVVIGAQVSYRDREGFGRRRMEVPGRILTEWVAEQVADLAASAARAGIEIGYVKPHGALYNRVVEDPDQAAAVLAGCPGLPVLGLPGGLMLELARAQGRRTVAEAFPDRGYTAEGRLLPRDRPGALITEPELVALRAVELAGSGRVETVCVHGDAPEAVAAARGVRQALERAGFAVRAWAR